MLGLQFPYRQLCHAYPERTVVTPQDPWGMMNYPIRFQAIFSQKCGHFLISEVQLFTPWPGGTLHESGLGRRLGRGP